MKNFFIATLLASSLTTTACAQSTQQSVPSAPDPAFDIVEMEASTDGRLLTFAMAVAGLAGSVKPVPIGQLAGAKAQAYVWPTSLNPATVGFEADSGILALAITSHPDFDDTPLFDEDRDGDPANDGADWHSHWVVLVEDSSCGAGLKVRDVTPGQDILPATAPHLPIALDSPGMSPILDGDTARITVPIADAGGVSFDAVTAELQVNAEGTAPLLCVIGVHDVMSGDLSLPGRVTVTHDGH